MVAAPAGAVTGSFAATCKTQSGGLVISTTHRTITYEVHAPDSVAPGAAFDVPVSFGYAVPEGSTVGGARIDVDNGSLNTILMSVAPGSPETAGTLHLFANSAPGSVTELRLRDLIAAKSLGGSAVGEICTPDHTLVLARVGSGIPLVSIGDGAIVEGSSGTRGLQFAVTVSRPAPTAVTVPFTVEPGTATPGSDYTTESGTVTLQAGAATGIATVRVRGDSIVEPKENFRVRLHDPVGAALGRAVGTGRIIDDDPEPGLRLSIGDASAVEGNRSVRSMRFVVSLSAPATQDTWFHYATSDGTAVANVDYRPQSFDYFIPAGHSSITVPVPVVTNETPESAKSMVMTLSGPPAGRAGATIGRAKGVGTIIDDD